MATAPPSPRPTRHSTDRAPGRRRRAEPAPLPAVSNARGRRTTRADAVKPPGSPRRLCGITLHRARRAPDTEESFAMTDNIGIAADGRHTFAAAGNREDVWHRFGQYNMDGKSMDEWLDAAGLLWTAIKSQARLDLDPAQWPHLTEAQRRAVVESRHHIVRSDNGYPLGFGSDQF